MTYGGEALGRHEGKAIFVTGGLPGEVVRIAVEDDRARFARGRVIEVIEPSPDRVVPRCPHFGFDSTSCGGCQWQHIDYSAQLRATRLPSCASNCSAWAACSIRRCVTSSPARRSGSIATTRNFISRPMGGPASSRREVIAWRRLTSVTSSSRRWLSG